MTATSFHARLLGEVETGAPHVRVQVFSGPDAEHRALAGTLIMRPDEAAAFLELVNGGGRPLALGTIRGDDGRAYELESGEPVDDEPDDDPASAPQILDRQRRVQLAEAMFAAARLYERDEALRLASAVWPRTEFEWRPSTGQVVWPDDRCRHPDCRDTNWGGHGRVHTRDSRCPADEVGRHLAVRMEDVP